jgi:hypothetical protein
MKRVTKYFASVQPHNAMARDIGYRRSRRTSPLCRVGRSTEKCGETLDPANVVVLGLFIAEVWHKH